MYNKSYTYFTFFKILTSYLMSIIYFITILYIENMCEKLSMEKVIRNSKELYRG